MASQRSHVESINTLYQGTLVFFKSIYRESNLRAQSWIFKSSKNHLKKNKKYLRALYQLVKTLSTT